MFNIFINPILTFLVFLAMITFAICIILWGCYR